MAHSFVSLEIETEGGVVARHVLTGQTVAMKYLSKEAIAASGTKTRVLREVQYMRTLKHAHIVKL